MYSVILSSRYRRSLKRIKRHKDFNRAKLEEAIGILERGEKLPQKYSDHELTGNLKGYRECHVQNDLLLVYQIVKGELVLLLVNLGSHSDLF